MAKHKALKDAIREKEIRQRLMDMLKEQYQRGLLVGSRAMLKTIGDKIAEKDEKTSEAKLAEVMAIINNLLGMTDKTAQEEAAKTIEEIGNSVDALTAAEEETAQEEKAGKIIEFPTPSEDGK